MDHAIWLVALLATVLAATSMARRLRLAEPLVLTVIGVVASYLPFIPQVQLHPDVVLIGLLPPLLYAAASASSLVDFRHEIEAITALSVFLVIFTAAGVALAAWALLPIPFAAAFALGAVVAPPDAVAATAVARRIGLPRRVVTLLEGESLVNDAIAIVLLRTAMAALGATVTAVEVGRSFLISALGGVAVGVVVAIVVSKVYRLLSDTPTSTGLSLITPWLAYLPAEELHASGVLAVVVAGLLIAHKAPYRQTALTRISSRINWATIQFMLENTVFLVMGLQVRAIIDALASSELGWGRITLALAGILAAVLALRPMWLAAGYLLPRRRPERRLAGAELVVVSWAGMRGVVTLAAAFALPESTPHREVLVGAALVVVGGTLLLQGATLPWLARRLAVEGPDPREDALQEAQILQAAGRAGLSALDELRSDPADRVDDAVADDLRARSERRVNAVWESLRAHDEGEAPGETYRRARLAMLTAEREEVLAMRNQGRGDHEVLQHVMTSLDIEESMLEGLQERAHEVRQADVVTPTTVRGACDHLADAAARQDAPPSADHCLDCDREGTEPVHLRMCVECGNVGCCDSSPGLHATRHFQDTGHPVMRSFEPGERWRWCYVDQLLD